MSATDAEQRLRDLNGVLELALNLAADVAVEAHTDPESGVSWRGMDSHAWFELFLANAQKKLRDAGRFGGRWVLFSDDEITTMWHAAFCSPEQDLESELMWEAKRRGLPIASDEPDTVSASS